MARFPQVVAAAACLVALSLPGPARAAFPSWVLTPGSSDVLQTAAYNLTWAKVVQQYFLYALEDSPDVLADPNADYCQDRQQPFGIWFGRQRALLQNCTVSAAKYQYAVFPVATYVYFQVDNLNPRFASTTAAEQTCALYPIDTPADDTLVVAINGQTVDPTPGTHAQQTLATTPQAVAIPVYLGNDTAVGQANIGSFTPFVADFPNPSTRSIEAVQPSFASERNPGLAVPANPSLPYPDYYVFNSFLGGHFIAVDLANAPANISLSIIDWQMTFDNTQRATADTCALCGLCPPSLPCPFNTTAFPNNAADFCSSQLKNVNRISGDALTGTNGDGLGPFTWNINVASLPINSA